MTTKTTGYRIDELFNGSFRAVRIAKEGRWPFRKTIQCFLGRHGTKESAEWAIRKHTEAERGDEVKYQYPYRRNGEKDFSHMIW